MDARQQERASTWLQIANTLAKTPAGSHGKLALVIFTLVAGVFLPGAVLILFSNAGATAEDARNMQFAGYALLGLGILSLALAAYQRRVNKRNRALDASLIRKAGEYSGTVVNSVGAAHWLGQHWHGEYSQCSLLSHSDIFRATLQLPAGSVFIDLTPKGFGTGSSSAGVWHWWAHVLLAVGSPFPDGTIVPRQPSLQRIEDKGYEVQCEAGCLIARGAPALEKTFAKDPASILEIFNVAVQLAKVATSMRA